MFQTASDLGGTQFYIDFYILPISVSEAILGVQWLKSLGHIVTDYANLTYEIHLGKRDINVYGITTRPIEKISSSQLKR